MNTENEFIKTEEEKELMERILIAFKKSIICYGHVDIDGLPDDEADVKTNEFIREIINSKKDITWTIDHKDTLLKEARKLLAEEKHDLAFVVYATWWEHWINGILEAKLHHRGFTEKEFKQVITSLNNHAKTTWFLKVLELPPFEKYHLDIMAELAGKRNGFVHYKYPATNYENEDMAAFFKKIETSIVYFMEYENINIFQSKQNFEI